MKSVSLAEQLQALQARNAVLTKQHKRQAEAPAEPIRERNPLTESEKQLLALHVQFHNALCDAENAKRRGRNWI